jgi:hypothetical protein
MATRNPSSQNISTLKHLKKETEKGFPTGSIDSSRSFNLYTPQFEID